MAGAGFLVTPSTVDARNTTAARQPREAGRETTVTSLAPLLEAARPLPSWPVPNPPFGGTPPGPLGKAAPSPPAHDAREARHLAALHGLCSREDLP